MIGELHGRVLVTGAAGMLGSQLLLDAPDEIEAVATDLVAARPGTPAVAHVGVDLADPRATERLFEAVGPFVGVIHAAGYTAVDQAEQEPELAHRANARSPEVLALACRRASIPMVLVGTDFVFDGARSAPYREDAPCAPLGVYGKTKREGEERALVAWPEGVRIARTQWLYGPRGRHFPGTMLQLARERDRLMVVADQVGTPTSTLELSPALWDLLRVDEVGIWHAACTGETSWHGFASAVFEITGCATPIDPCTTEQFPRPAPRPAYSVLDSSRLARLRGHPLQPWREALVDFLSLEYPEGLP